MRNQAVVFLILVCMPLFGQQTEDIFSREMTGELRTGRFAVVGWDNPARLSVIYTRNYTSMAPFVSSVNGEYRRPFDPQSTVGYGVKTESVKMLGENGTFVGTATYGREERNSIRRSLRYDTYAGDPFFYQDSSTGNFVYSGPDIEFGYAHEMSDLFSFGADVRYTIADGLKSVYTRAQVLDRNLEYSIGVTVKPFSEFTAGAAFRGSSGQERIDSKSEQLLDVETFTSHGETYSVRRSSGELEHKYTRSGGEGSMFADYAVNDQFRILLDGEFGIGKLRSLSHKTVEYEDGYSESKRYGGGAMVEYTISDGSAIDGSFEYGHTDSWSKLSGRELLLWEWQVNIVTGRAGLNYTLTEKIRIRGEAFAGTVTADSNKYIDNRYWKKTTANFGGAFVCDAREKDSWEGQARILFESRDRDYVKGGKKYFAAVLQLYYSLHITGKLWFESTYNGEVVTASVGGHSLKAVIHNFGAGIRFYD